MPPLTTGSRISLSWRWVRRNRKYDRDFDSTKGYPGEGPSKRSPTGRLPRGAPTNTWGIPIRRRDKFVMVRSSQADRARARAGISLHSSGLAPRTVARYRVAFRALWAWLSCDPPASIVNFKDFDMILSDFIEAGWKSGMTKGMAGDCLSAALAVYPEVRGHLHSSWRLLACWSRIELPSRAPPITPTVLLAVVGKALLNGQYSFAFLCALGFDCALRTGEILHLAEKDISFSSSGDLGAVNLLFTKSGQRNAAFEAVTVLDPLVYRLWRLHRKHLVPHTSILHFVWPFHEQRVRDLFSQYLEELGLAGFAFRPYSLRRGGITTYYRRTGNLAASVDRGRWSNARTARIYVCDGLAKETEILLSPTVTDTLQSFIRPITSLLSAEDL